ncbi:DNA-processing protein DprA [Paenochrobactrum pullorum]|uniref:DNA-processing protein DprA n=1 Tax=Paenochrobactrum pullorum TaxID=1324351 RepID=UPI0035BBCAB3
MNDQAVSPHGIRLSDQQRLNWLRLIRSENIGPVTFRDLILHCGSASNALEMLPELSRRGGSYRRIRLASLEQVTREMEAVEHLGARLIGMGEPDYPLYLKNCDAPPPLITVQGDLSVFTKPPVGIVGSRNASIAGARFTQKIAAELGKAGFAIISGLARGIDAAAHQYSLKTGTVAVLAGGIDRPYPPQNIGLYHEIPENGGAVVSEMPLGWEPRAQDFPRRNRIISALSSGLLVVEAAKRSGSLITARMAGEMGRVVFAVPGSPLDPRASGTNELIKHGALLVTEANDIIEALSPQLVRQSQQSTDKQFTHQPDQLSLKIEEVEQDYQSHSLLNTTPHPEKMTPPASDKDREQIFNLLSPVPVSVDEIIRHTGIEPAQVFLILLELDLAGQLSRYPNGHVALMPSM